MQRWFSGEYCWGRLTVQLWGELCAKFSLYVMSVGLLRRKFLPSLGLVYAITFSSFKEVCTAGFYKEPMKVGESVCGVQNKIGKEDKMANKVENRISYAAAYALLKKYAVQNAITP